MPPTRGVLGIEGNDTPAPTEQPMKIKSNVKAGLAGSNHNRKLVSVKSNVKAGLAGTNHSRKLVRA